MCIKAKMEIGFVCKKAKVWCLFVLILAVGMWYNLCIVLRDALNEAVFYREIERMEIKGES